MKTKRIKSSWTEYFNFSTQERRGSIFLALIILMQICVLIYQRNAETELLPADPGMIASILKAESELVHKRESAHEIFHPIDSVVINSFDFDPNNIDEKSWLSLGLSSRQYKVIQNFMSHGGRFRVKSDFKKMYCISDSEFEKLEPHLLLPDSLPTRGRRQYKKEIVSLQVDIGIADSVVFTTLRGIGPVLASRIIKYREKLGGFCAIAQLKEVWGINDSVFEVLLPHINLNSNEPLRYVHLNTDSFNVLASHPYIRFKIAGLICNFRKQHPFNSIDELRQLPLITEENFTKLAPYLKTE